MSVFNPTSAIITAPTVVRDGVTGFRLVAKRVDSVVAGVTVPVPAPNADGTYTVALGSLTAAIPADDYGAALSLFVQAVAPSGSSAATAAPDDFVYQPVPTAPAAVALG